MKLFIADAFSDKHFGGNPAGVALLSHDEDFPTDTWMQLLAAELKHSETAFIKPESDGTFSLRYFTPAGEVDLCGHATIASFTVLKDEGLLVSDINIAHTKAGKINVYTNGDSVLMTMAAARTLRTFDLSVKEDAELVDEFYKAFGIDASMKHKKLLPEVISTGLPDIMLPVKDKKALSNLKPDFPYITEISKRLDVVGFHVFSVSDDDEITADCRNFAPLYDIDEEAATGTSNGALTWYLYKHKLIDIAAENTFLQGEVMGRASKIMSKITDQHDILIGGKAVILFRGHLE